MIPRRFLLLNESHQLLLLTSVIFVLFVKLSILLCHVLSTAKNKAQLSKIEIKK